jgi:hypothetical protein
MRAPCYVLEGTWWSNREVPKVLPYFEALQASHGPFHLGLRTIRSAEDIAYWMRKIPRGAGAFVYVTCHGAAGNLYPADGRSPVTRQDLLDALSAAKPGAVQFLHIGTCEIVDKARRRQSLQELAVASGARWVSGYVTAVDWLRSMFLDLAVVAELYVPYFADARGQAPKLKVRADQFVRDYEQLARALGFSALCRNTAGGEYLIPQRLRDTA